MEDLHFTTCVVARLDPSTRRLCLATAGHLAPVLVAPGGAAWLLELDPGLPPGVGGAHIVEQTHDLEPGSLLMFYTVGLVECRDAPISDGLDRLVGALSGPVTSADEACDRVLRDGTRR